MGVASNSFGGAPMPSCPAVLDPQHCIWPWVTAQDKFTPTEIEVTPLVSPVTGTGVADCV
jgi:hypothetical protein